MTRVNSFLADIRKDDEAALIQREKVRKVRWHCVTCPFETSDPVARDGHTSYAPPRGWLGNFEQHIFSEDDPRVANESPEEGGY